MQLLSLFTLHVAVSAAFTIPTGLTKRKAETNATLVAYGTNTSSWPIAYGVSDGMYSIRQVLGHTDASKSTSMALNFVPTAHLCIQQVSSTSLRPLTTGATT